MSMPTEAVEALHTITAELKAEHERMQEWMTGFDELKAPEPGKTGVLNVTRAEAERIFADRIAAHEAKLKELGWTRTIRVDPDAEAAERERRNQHIIDMAKAI